MKSFKDIIYNIYIMTSNVRTTYLYDGSDNPPTSVTKELSPGLVIDTIREFIFRQYRYLYSTNPTQEALNTLINGFIAFNLHKNADMLQNKKRLNDYVCDKNLSREELVYFLDIVLQIQKPYFLTQDEMEYIRAIGTLDGYGR
jgi:hypothetical protein